MKGYTYGVYIKTEVKGWVITRILKIEKIKKNVGVCLGKFKSRKETIDFVLFNLNNDFDILYIDGRMILFEWLYDLRLIDK
jgi:hypothetical protein